MPVPGPPLTAIYHSCPEGLLTSVRRMEVEHLVNQHKDAVYRQMVRVCGNQDDAEDSLAEAIFGALKAVDQLRDQDHFRAWLARIGTRSCVRMKLRERLLSWSSLTELEEMGIEVPDRQAGPAEELEAKEIKRCVAGAVEALPSIYHEVYLRREIFGEPAEEVASALEISVSALKSRLHRARAIVRESMDSHLGCSGLAETLG